MSYAIKKSLQLLGRPAFRGETRNQTDFQGEISIDGFSVSPAQLEMLEAVPEATTIHGSSGKLLWASSRAQSTFDGDTDALKEFGFLQGINPQDGLSLLQHIDQVRVAGTSEPFEIRKTKPGDGELALTQVLEIRANKFASETEQLVILTIRDVTERADMDRIARERIDDAENANRLKNSIISNVSHELRTPLNAIIGFSEMLRGDSGENIKVTKRREYADHIHGSASHLLDLINSMLDVSKIEAGKLEISAERFDFEEAMIASLKLMEPISEKAGITIETEFPEECPPVFADKRAVRQITQNLVSNALKFSSRGSRVKISVSRKAQSICLSVKDQGIGMDKETVEKLGTTFFQAQQSLGREAEGTGLGLSIVKGLVELHKGTIRFESEPGIGTEVMVELPLNASHGRPVPVDPDNTLVFINSNQQLPGKSNREPAIVRKMG